MNRNNKYSKLLKNTSIYAIGTFGTKILNLIIIPLYTHYLTTSEYGLLDLFVSTINLLIPFTTLMIYEAAICFTIGKESDEKTILNNCVFIYKYTSIIVLVITFVILFFAKNDNSFYIILFSILVLLQGFTTIFGQWLRATSKNIKFSISGVIQTLFTLIPNLIFLVVFHLGIIGYIFALIIGYLASSIYILFNSDIFNLYDASFVDKNVLNKMVKYSLPLVPNNLMWWIMNAGDKYIIGFFLGTEQNGIFSLSYKIPTVLSMLFSIFMQAWQVSALEEKNSDSNEKFIKNIFNVILYMLALVTSLLFILIEPFFQIFISKDFLYAWKFVPFLCIATIMNCFSSFFGVVYILNKDSKKSSITTMIGAITNLIVNIILISKYQLYGVAVGTIFGYMFVMLIRYSDFSKYYNISLIGKRTIIILLLLFFQFLSLYFTNGKMRYILNISICLIVFFNFMLTLKKK